MQKEWLPKVAKDKQLLSCVGMTYGISIENLKRFFILRIPKALNIKYKSTQPVYWKYEGMDYCHICS